MSAVAIVLTLVVALTGAALVGVLVARAMAVQVTAQARSDRERTLRETVDTVVTMAGDKLGDHLAMGSRELDLRNETFEQRATEMKRELERVTEMVGAMQRERAQQHGSLLAGLEQATLASTRLAETTQHLREALASPKARGQWGERMADDVLRAAGFVEGTSYVKQTSTASGTIPDFTFLLPGGWRLNMDVKFPIDNYLRYLEATTDADRDRCSGAFLRDVRNRVKELAKRGYLDGDDTLDELVLFIPNEAVYAFIHEHDVGLLEVCLRERIVPCSPTTLFAVLAVIRQAVDQFRFERTSDEILRCLTGFRQQWDKFADSLDVVAKRFETAQRGMEDLTGTRRRMLERQLDVIDDLASRRGLDAVAALGDGEGEAIRRSTGDVRPLPEGRAAG